MSGDEMRPTGAARSVGCLLARCGGWHSRSARDDSRVRQFVSRELYGERFYASQKDGSVASAEQILPLVFDLVDPASVVDVGCGTGSWLAVARHLGADTILGIDGAWVPENSLCVPADCFLEWDLTRPLQLQSRRFDLAICMEVAEHLDAQHADSLIADLCALSDVVLFSAAIPGQTGTDHRNEQWPPYWRSRFQQWGYELVDCLRSRLWSDDRVEPWYAQNAYLYVHSDRLAVDTRLREASAETGRMPLDAVHPRTLGVFSRPLNPPNPEPAERKPAPRRFMRSIGSNAAPMPKSAAPYAIVTPYFAESQALLRRCIDSVKAQTVAVDHILVADGAPQDWIDAENVRHIRLDRPHGDYGNTPRAIGAMLAASAECAGIGFLDADNWLEPEHVATCVETALRATSQGRVDYVIARRSLRRPDGSQLPCGDEPIEKHVDTNCFFLLPGSYHILPYFGLMPRALSAIADRVFYDALRQRGLSAAVNTAVTVNYQCLWAAVYESLGETPPPGAKPKPPWGDISAWLATKSRDEQRAIRKICGIQP